MAIYRRYAEPTFQVRRRTHMAAMGPWTNAPLASIGCGEVPRTPFQKPLAITCPCADGALERDGRRESCGAIGVVGRKDRTES